MGDVPVKVLSAPFRVEPTLVEVAIGLRFGDVGMRRDPLLEVFPHVQYNAFVIPPIDIMLFGLFEILFPSVHRRSLIFRKDVECCQMSSYHHELRHHHVADKQSLAGQYEVMIREA